MFVSVLSNLRKISTLKITKVIQMKTLRYVIICFFFAFNYIASMKCQPENAGKHDDSIED